MLHVKWDRQETRTPERKAYGAVWPRGGGLSLVISIGVILLNWERCQERFRT